jgi:hypothetical protein
MAEQSARVLRSSLSLEIGRGGAQGKALLARTDRHRNHVLLQPLAIPDAGVATGREYVNEILLGDYLQANVRIGGENAGTIAGSTSRAALTGTFSFSVPAGRSRRPCATSMAASTSLSAGVSRSSRRSPAS